MRVLLFATDLDLGGAEVQVVRLAEGFHRRGHQVLVVTLIDPVALTEELDAANVPWASLGIRRGVPDPRAALRLRRHVRTFRPDVVHAHMVHANLLARLARLIVRMPRLITTAHNTVEGGRAIDIAYRVTDVLGDMTTNVSEAAVQAFVQRGATPANRIRFVPNGLDLGRWQLPRPPRDGPFRWLAAGRMTGDKDFMNLLEALELVPGESELLLAGDGPERPQLEARAGSRVRFLGRRRDMPELMASADAFVLPSRVEGLPMVLLEAAAAGLPAVATTVGGNAEVIAEGETGLLVPPRDPVSLAAALRRIEALPAAELQRMGDAARHLVAEAYSMEAVLDTWERMYAEN